MKVLKKGEYYGSMKKKMNVDGILLSEYSYEQKNTEWHFHENPYFMYVLQGNLFDSNKKNETQCVPGSLMFLNWEDKHHNSKHSQEAGGFHIEIDQNWFSKLDGCLEIQEGSFEIKNPKIHLMINHLYKEFHLADDLSQLGIEASIYNLLNCLSLDFKMTDKQPPWFRRLLQILHEENMNVNLGGLSEILGVHPVHISRTASKYLGMTLSEYTRIHRIKKALDLMRCRDLSLTEISYLSGFSDQSHFSKSFSNVMGKTPSDFRSVA